MRNDEGVVPYDSLPLEGKVSPQVTDEVSTVTRLDNETVSYYYDSKTTLEYSLTYTGFKEDIVVSEYTGQTEYHFLLETGGLTLTKIDESYYLTDENGEVKATLGDIIIFTADERNNALGSMTHETVKENELYIITIHVDAEYLKDEKTKYPIRIDPTIEITHDNNGSGAIQDVTLNENSGSSGSSGSIYVGKRNTYGISRTLMKFPGLNLNTIPSANNVISAYVEIRDMMCETTSMMVYGCIFMPTNVWSESSVSWSGLGNEVNWYTSMLSAEVEVKYSIGATLNPKHRYSIDITQAVKGWKTGFYNQETGIMLKANDDVEGGTSALYKTFASYNRASNKPSLKVNYQAQEIFLSYDTDKGANMAVGQTRQVIVQSDYTPTATAWSTSNRNVATVSNAGLVTGKAPGTVDITATYTFAGGVTSTKSIRFYVKNSLGIVDNENYYIMNYASKKFLSLESTTVANGTNIIVRDRSTDAISKWQLSAEGNKEYYLINNGSLADRVLTRESTNASIWSPINPLPQYFTILRIDEGTYTGLYLICIGEYYLTQDSSGTNAYFTTYTTSCSYWSLMKVAKGEATIISFNAQKESGEFYNTSGHNNAFLTNYNSMGYHSNSLINETPANAYMNFKTDDIIFYHGHSVPGALIFTQNWSSTTPHYSGGIAVNSQLPVEARAGIANTYMKFIDELNTNNMKNARVVFYLSCNSGVNYVDSNNTFNLVDATYDKGAHFVLGTIEVTYNTQVNEWMADFEECIKSGTDVQAAINRAQVLGVDRTYSISGGGTISGHLGELYCRGDGIQFLN